MLEAREGGRDFLHLGVHTVKRVCHRPGGRAALLAGGTIYFIDIIIFQWDLNPFWLGGLLFVFHWLDQSSAASVGGSSTFHTHTHLFLYMYHNHKYIYIFIIMNDEPLALVRLPRWAFGGQLDSPQLQFES